MGGGIRCVAGPARNSNTEMSAYPSFINTRFMVMPSNVVEFILNLLVVRRKGD